jgi:hypothetical protein
MTIEAEVRGRKNGKKTSKIAEAPEKTIAS